MNKLRIQILQSKRHFSIPTHIESAPVLRHFKIDRVQLFDSKLKPDLIYVQTFGTYLDFLNKTKIPYVMHMGGNPWLELRGAKLEKTARALSGAVLVVCVSEFLANQIRKNLPGVKHIVSLPGGMWGMDHSKLGPKVSRFKEKTDYELSNPPTVIMSMGLKDDERLENKWRGIPIFLEAVKEVSKEHGVRFVCAGRGSYQFSKLTEWKEKYNFNFVQSHQLDDETDLWPDMLHGSDIFIHPGTYDCWPRVIAEAMITGLPCMTFEVTGNAEVGGSVYKFDLDCDLLASEFKILLMQKGVRECWGRSCRQEALENTEKHRGDYVALLLKLVGGFK